MAQIQMVDKNKLKLVLTELKLLKEMRDDIKEELEKFKNAVPVLLETQNIQYLFGMFTKIHAIVQKSEKTPSKDQVLPMKSPDNPRKRKNEGIPREYFHLKRPCSNLLPSPSPPPSSSPSSSPSQKFNQVRPSLDLSSSPQSNCEVVELDGKDSSFEFESNVIPLMPSPTSKVGWSGILEWKELTAVPDDPDKIFKMMLQAPCRIELEEQLEWPKTISMQLVPKEIFLRLTTNSFENVKSFNVHLEDGESKSSLVRMMSTGLAGVVQCVSEDSLQMVSNSPRVFLLFFSRQENSFLGFILHDENQFIQEFRTNMTRAKKTMTRREN